MNTPKNFALQLGSLITLYISLTSLLTLLFAVITLAIPDSADSYYTTESAAGTIRFSIAMLIVFFPVYLWLTRMVNQIRRTETGVYLTLTKWLVYGSLLVGGGVLLGDVVAVIYGFLEGDLTLRFMLKAGVLALVIGTAFYYYLMDAKGHWQAHERTSLYFGAAITTVVLAAITLGFMHSETPSEVREMKIDNEQVGDLQDMQWRIEDYYRSNEVLPADLATLYGDFEAPVAPDERSAYIYEVESATEYTLCATFSHDSASFNNSTARPYFEKNYNWEHKAGEWCFERKVDNEFQQ